MISGFLTKSPSIILWEGEHPVSYLGPHTTAARLAGRAGCWPAISLDLFWWSSYLCEWNLIPQQQHSSQNGNVTSFHPCLCLVLHFVANPKRHHIGQPTTKIWAHVWILLRKSDFNSCRYCNWTFINFFLTLLSNFK